MKRSRRHTLRTKRRPRPSVQRSLSRIVAAARSESIDSAACSDDDHASELAPPVKKRLKVDDQSRPRRNFSSAVTFSNGEEDGETKNVEPKGKENIYSDPDEVEMVDNWPRFSDLGGMNQVVDMLKRKVLFPMLHPYQTKRLGVRPISGILLHGPPGCGKTTLAHAIANEAGVPFYYTDANELVSGISDGEKIRELFSKAYRTAPSIVFIDEIDTIASKRDNLNRETDRRIVTQLMSCMDESCKRVRHKKDACSKASVCRPNSVLVIAATNRPDALDAALRRPGRFDREIRLGIPDDNARVEILSVLTSDLGVEGDFDLLKLARCTPGFVGADLDALINEAGILAMERTIDQRKSELSMKPLTKKIPDAWLRHPFSSEETEKLHITIADFEEAAKMVQPSTRREGFSSIPNVKWEDVGGLDSLRKVFEDYIIDPIKYPEDCEEFGLQLETGFLLYGPPGCGKTLIAKAVAGEAGANFIHIKVDALTTKRGIEGGEGGGVVNRLVNQLLIELDGAEQRHGVYVIAATNRPEVIDPALLRSGRLEKHLPVPLSSADERGLILKALAKNKPIDATVDLVAIGKHISCENMSGADLAALMKEAAMAAKKDKRRNSHNSDGTRGTIKAKHFEWGLEVLQSNLARKTRVTNVGHGTAIWDTFSPTSSGT